MVWRIFTLLILSIFYWWRRRESNPRPKTFRCSFYVRSLGLLPSRRIAPQGGSAPRYPVKFRRPFPGKKFGYPV